MKVNLIVFRRLVKMRTTKNGRRQWRKMTMEEEMESLLENETWVLVMLPKGREPLQNKWLYMIKHEREGNKERYKARLVVKGFTQKEGIDFTEIIHPLLKCHPLELFLVPFLLQIWSVNN
jgi:hypothetical protein